MLHTFSGIGRSRFIPIIVESIKTQKRAFDLGSQVIIEFDEEKAGYPGSFEVNVNPSKEVFTVEFSNTDPTRFPARIKAAARALCQEGYNGRFEISHKAGTLKIMRLR